jgi:hypothetical protein
MDDINGRFTDRALASEVTGTRVALGWHVRIRLEPRVVSGLETLRTYLVQDCIRTTRRNRSNERYLGLSTRLG